MSCAKSKQLFDITLSSTVPDWLKKRNYIQEWLKKRRAPRKSRRQQSSKALCVKLKFTDLRKVDIPTDGDVSLIAWGASKAKSSAIVRAKEAYGLSNSRVPVSNSTWATRENDRFEIMLDNPQVYKEKDGTQMSVFHPHIHFACKRKLGGKGKWLEKNGRIQVFTMVVIREISKAEWVRLNDRPGTKDCPFRVRSRGEARVAMQHEKNVFVVR